MRWWLPSDLFTRDRPDHWPTGGIACVRGPDDGPGLVVGCGPYQPGEDGWLPLHDGMMFHPGDNSTELLLRLAPIAGPALMGALPTQVWMVPRLLQPGLGGLECALPRVLTDRGFEAPAAYSGLLDRLRLAVLDPAVLGEDALAQLAIDILNCNYRITRAEIVAAGWLTDQLASDILITAAGLTDEGAAA